MASAKYREKKLVRRLIKIAAFAVVASVLAGQYRMGNIQNVATALYNKFQPSVASVVDTGKKVAGDYREAANLVANIPGTIVNTNAANEEKQDQLNEVFAQMDGESMQGTTPNGKRFIVPTLKPF